MAWTFCQPLPERVTPVGITEAHCASNPSVPYCRDVQEINSRLFLDQIRCREAVVPRLAARQIAVEIPRKRQLAIKSSLYRH